MAYTIAVLVGSLREASLNRKLITEMTKLAPDTLSFKFIEIADLPFYNEDLETETPPAPWTRFRDEMKDVDGVLFATPEYNRSLPAAIKNALDVGSRPYGDSIWAGKPAGVVTASMGATGGFGANHHLRQALVFLDMPTLQQPEAYIGKVQDILTDDGVVDSSRDFLAGFMSQYAKWVETFKG